MHYTVAADATAGSPPSRRACSATPARTRASARRCSNEPPATPAARTTSPTLTSRRSRPTRTTSLRRLPRLRREPGAVRDGGGDRSSRREDGDRSLGAPLQERARGRAHVHERAGVREERRLQEDAPRREARYERRAPRGRRRHRVRIKNSGIGNGALEWGKVRLVMDAPRQVSLYNGYTEMGQGLLTVLVQCAVESTGLAAQALSREGRLHLPARLRPDHRAPARRSSAGARSSSPGRSSAPTSTPG